MKKITYFCDLCKVEIHIDSKGAYLGHAFTLQAVSNTALFCSPDKADAHICRGCWHNLKSLTKEEDHQNQIAVALPRDIPTRI